MESHIQEVLVWLTDIDAPDYVERRQIGECYLAGKVVPPDLSDVHQGLLDIIECHGHSGFSYSYMIANVKHRLGNLL